jgi:hypothetical protein
LIKPLGLADFTFPVTGADGVATVVFSTALAETERLADGEELLAEVPPVPAVVVGVKVLIAFNLSKSPAVNV